MHRFERCQSTESIWEEREHGTFFGTTLRSTQQPMRRISWAASLCLPLPVDNKKYSPYETNTKTDFDKDTVSSLSQINIAYLILGLLYFY